MLSSEGVLHPVEGGALRGGERDYSDIMPGFKKMSVSVITPPRLLDRFVNWRRIAISRIDLTARGLER